MVFRELESLQETLPDTFMVFERQRLLNLIDSKVKRRELEIAICFAEELFRREIKHALTTRTRHLLRCGATLRKTIVVLLGVFSIFTMLTVLNVWPLFSLVVSVAAMTGIVSGVLLDGFLAKRLAKAAAAVLDVYETGRKAFVERVLTGGVEQIDSEGWMRMMLSTH